METIRDVPREPDPTKLDTHCKARVNSLIVWLLDHETGSRDVVVFRASKVGIFSICHVLHKGSRGVLRFNADRIGYLRWDRLEELVVDL